MFFFITFNKKTEMKYLFIPIMLLTIHGYSQIFYCSYSGGACSSGLQPPSNLAVGVVANVCQTLVISQIPVFQGDVANACAFADDLGNRIITYNPNFLNYLYTNNQWAPISVLAHEVGHHYAMHSSWYGTFMHPWTKELQSDYISGYVLFKLGCPTIQDALSAMNLMFTYTGSASHPDSPKRMDALIQGYIRASQGF
jgi:hypothetical protein